MIRPNTIATFLLAFVISDAALAAPPPGRTLGFVIRNWYTAIYETKFMDECPLGLNISNDEYWWRGLPSQEERARRTENGLIHTLNRWGPSAARGPGNENVCLNPYIIKDPQFLTIEGKTSFGANLDGDSTGKATAKTCAHENFTGVWGEPGVDNQMYRLLGCIYGFRADGIFEVNADEMRGTSGLGITLIEVTNVDDARNDDDVMLTFYRSVDQFTLDPNGQPLPFATYRIDVSPDGTQRYGHSLKGKIKDGKITSEQGDVRLPFYGNYNFMHPVIKEMSVDLEVSNDGKKLTGFVNGYYDVDEFVYHVTGVGAVISTAGYSCPGLAEYAWKLADGHPDENGKCTTISSSFKVTGYAAFIKKPDAKVSQK